MAAFLPPMVTEVPFNAEGSTRPAHPLRSVATLTRLVPKMEIRPPGFADIHNPLNQHLQFLEAVRDGRPAPVPISSGVRDLRVVEALYESARSGRAVECA